MHAEFYPISDFKLILSMALVVIVGSISALLKLGLLKSLLWGTFRTFAQLLLVGYALVWIFSLDSPILLLMILLIMCYFGARTAVKRTKGKAPRQMTFAYLSLAVSTFIVTFIVTGIIISADKWYTARIVIPIAGMVLGNSMNGLALALDRLFAEVRSHSGEIETLLALGATPWEAIRRRLQEALKAGMTPTINSLMVVGLVTLPGMMTGQILGGVNPTEAVRYQIVVMLMITAAAAIASLLMIILSYKRLFNAEGALLPELWTTVERKK